MLVLTDLCKLLWTKNDAIYATEKCVAAMSQEIEQRRVCGLFRRGVGFDDDRAFFFDSDDDRAGKLRIVDTAERSSAFGIWLG